MIQPNQLAQATKELSNLDLGDYKIPKLIHETEAKYHYVCIGIRSRDALDGMSKIHTARTVYSSINKWQDMKREVTSGRVKTVFNGAFAKVVILNNPTLPASAPKKPKVKDLSPTQKSKVNALMEEGKGQDDEGLKAIAKEVGVSFDRVKAYIKSF